MKFYRKKNKKFKTGLMTSFILLLVIIITLINIMKFRVICSGSTTVTLARHILFLYLPVSGKVFDLLVTRFGLLNFLCTP